MGASAPSPATSPTASTSAGAIGWGAYLACSWTWCIGMFLPALLLRDFGWWGFLVFAIPNCLGAGAMGWMISRRTSRRIIRLHNPALRCFGAVTIAFQCYFAGWLLVMLSGRMPEIFRFDDPPAASALMLALVAFACMLALAMAPIAPILGRRADPRLIWVGSLITLGFSLAMLLAIGAARAPAPLAGPGEGGVWDAPMLADLPLLAPVVIFGFLLCPYLDLTFHNARARGGTGAFIVGFFALFPLMILGTTLYAPALLDHRSAPLLLLAPITVHIGAQLLFTIFAHRERLESPRPINTHRAGRTQQSARPDRDLTPTLALLGCVLIAPAMQALGLASREINPGMTFTEAGYRLFMGFYGLAFPAYAWLVMIPTRDNSPRAQNRKLRICLLTIGVVAPMFYMGFIEMRELFLVPGMLIVLLARLALPGGPTIPRQSRQQVDQPPLTQDLDMQI